MYENVNWQEVKNFYIKNKSFIYLYHKISNFKYDNSEPSSLKSENKVNEKVQRLTGEESDTNKPDTSAEHPANQDDDIV